MVSTSQVGVRAPLASIHSNVSIHTGSAPTISHQDVHVFASRAIGQPIGDQSDAPLLLLQPLRATSLWENALIAVLFLLIIGLVGIRVAETLSNRNLEISSLPLITEATNRADDVTHSQTADHLAYEYYLSPETPPELLSDEGKVVRLLVANHGRIRQHRITEETGWSKSKVSRICSRMHADGTIEKASVGRENVITLSERTSDGQAHSDDVENPLP
ncbi:helix-turn-helix transcriptional regulator [Natrinema halophilum]|uniref:MarR family transcriptional regulator n=1 Tax=Natrinema halophilum TaxID=1699371 RepID=A0A7D5GVF2_9EURY|nr:MarR family transcriptional regulator [Natrinema halophilum]QLG50766.1 MarR family transcriptional regulator [Natrinema halophilum]